MRGEYCVIRSPWVSWFADILTVSSRRGDLRIRDGVNGVCSSAHLLSSNPSWTASNGGSSYTTVLPPVPPRASQDNADFVFENVTNGNGFAQLPLPSL